MQLKKIESTHINNIPLYYYPHLASTNQTLHSLIEEGSQLPIVVIAQEQSAGKGQWGRVWESYKGGLYLSLGLKSNFKLENALHLSLMSGWGVTEVLNLEGIPVTLKWPNDLLLHGRKLGGIKIETRCAGKGMISKIIIGIGINWHNPVPNLGTNLLKYPVIRSLEQLANLTVEGLLLGEESYRNGGIEAILPQYLNYLDSIGKRVTINGLTGQVVGVNLKGELLIRLSAPGASCTISCVPGMISLGYY